MTAATGARDEPELRRVLAVGGSATGALGVAAYLAGAAASRTYALGLGVVYLVVAAWGFVVGDGDTILSIVPVNTGDNVLHLVIGLMGVAAGVASKAETTPAMPGRVAGP